MKRRLGQRHAGLLRTVLVLLLLVPLVGTPLAGPGLIRGDQLSDAYAKQKTLERQIAAQKALLTSLKQAQADTAAALKETSAQLDSVNADLASVTAAVKKATAALADATRRYYDLVEQVRLIQYQLLWLEATQAQKAAELQARQEALAQSLSTAYQDSHVPLMAQLLNSGSLNDVLVEISYFLTMGDQDRQLAERIARDQQVLATMEATASQTAAQTTALRDEVASEKAALASQRKELRAAQAKLKALQRRTAALVAQQKAAYQRYASDATTAAALLAKQQKAEAALKALIDKLVRQRSSAYGIPSAYSGTLQWPMAGTVTQEFGCTGFYWEPPLGSCAHFHTGIDISNTLGTPIHAAGTGVVVYAGCGYDIYGACEVVIAHSQRLLTWYAHVTRGIPVRVGEHVAAGRIIAYEGMTGMTTGPHLHWAVELDGTWVNPRLFL